MVEFVAFYVFFCAALMLVGVVWWFLDRISA